MRNPGTILINARDFLPCYAANSRCRRLRSDTETRRRPEMLSILDIAECRLALNRAGRNDWTLTPEPRSRDNVLNAIDPKGRTRTGVQRIRVHTMNQPEKPTKTVWVGIASLAEHPMRFRETPAEALADELKRMRWRGTRNAIRQTSLDLRGLLGLESKP